MIRTLTFLAFLAASPVYAECRLALLLALDVSSSVDRAEDQLQRQGLADALASPEVRDAVFSIAGQSVALAAYEWSGRYQQAMLLGWTMLKTDADILKAADTIAASQRVHTEFPTALGYSIGYAASVFRDAPPCLFQTLDVSGDGLNNEGFGPQIAYRSFALAEVTVNGLTIGGQQDDLAAYYRQELIQGPGAFVEEAADYQDFQRAMQRKLIRELQAKAIGALEAPQPEGNGYSVRPKT